MSAAASASPMSYAMTTYTALPLVQLECLVGHVSRQTVTAEAVAGCNQRYVKSVSGKKYGE